MSLYIKHGLIVLVGFTLFGMGLISANTVSTESKGAVSLSDISVMWN